MSSELTQNYVLDPERLAALSKSGLLDSPPEEGFDRYTRLARQNLRARVSLFSLVDSQRQFFKSQCGLPAELCEAGGTELDRSMCVRVIETGSALVIDDTLDDPYWRNHPAVKEVGVRSYLGFPVHSAEGHLLGSFCVVDTDPRIWSELDLEIMNDLTHMMEEKIRLRAQIENRNQLALRLNETNLKLRQYSENVKQIMATVAHEIRTAVTSLKGHSEIACTTSDPTERDSSIKVIRQNSDYLLRLVNDMLDSSRIEAGQVQFESIVFDPRKLCADIIESLQPNVGSKPIQLRFENSCNDIPEYVSGDPTRIRQILMNLLSNALKFTGSGQVRLSLNFETMQENPRSAPNFVRHGALCFRVSDTGSGMTPDQIDSLFRPFSQADATIHRRFGGSGMGLFISKELAEAMGGSIEVESDLGEGSSFDVRIPVEIPSDAQIADMAPHREPPEKLAGKPRILVVEDSPDIQKVQQFLLKRAGCISVIANNGKEAIEEVRNATDPIDMILMDVHMPELDGFQATRAIRELGYRGPMIALSATVDDHELGKMLTSGCNTHLRKPMELRDFVKTARSLLSERDNILAN